MSQLALTESIRATNFARYRGMPASPRYRIREVDGSDGAIYLGRGKIVHERPTTELAELQRWRAEAVQPASALVGRADRS